MICFFLFISFGNNKNIMKLFARIVLSYSAASQRRNKRNITKRVVRARNFVICEWMLLPYNHNYYRGENDSLYFAFSHRRFDYLKYLLCCYGDYIRRPNVGNKIWYSYSCSSWWDSVFYSEVCDHGFFEQSSIKCTRSFENDIMVINYFQNYYVTHLNVLMSSENSYTFCVVLKVGSS